MRVNRRRNGKRAGTGVRAPVRDRALRLGGAALLAGVLGLTSGLAHAVTPSLPTCAQLASDLPGIAITLAPHGSVTNTGSAIIPAAAAVPANPPHTPTPIPATPAYCQVSFTYSTGLTGPTSGYAVGQTQEIKIIVYLPLSTADGGVTGSTPASSDGGTIGSTIQGNWLGKVMVSASAGSSGQVGSWANYGQGLDMTNPAYAIQLGYVGSSTDTGQSNLPPTQTNSANFGVIPATASPPNSLDLGAIADWTNRGTHYGKQWAVALTQTYYGKAPTRVYYDGCSGAGNEGMGQLQNFGDEYDGFLIGAPAYYWQQFRLADSWPALVFKKLVQQGGTLPTAGQAAALNTAVYAACDVEGTDTVADGIIADPRLCTQNFSANANICGALTAPASPNCLTAAQAAAFNRIWDGPRNSYGLRIWYPYDIGIPFTGGLGITISTSLTSSTVQVVQWNHKNNTFDANDLLFVDAESKALAGNPPGSITYEDEATLGANTTSDYTDNQNAILDKAIDHHTKVIQIHGTADGAIRWRQDVDYYKRVATWYSRTGTADFAKLQSWYRFFMMPSIGHCASTLGGGNGVSASDPFPALVNWVEHGVAPASLLGVANSNSTLPAGSTRPLCPYPQTAIYSGTGDTNVAGNFNCGGNLETPQVICDGVRAFYKFENANMLDYQDVGVTPAQCTARALRPPT